MLANPHQQARSSERAADKAHSRPDSPYFTATLFITRHGTSAIDWAAQEMDACQASGDGDGYLAWGLVSDAIVDLQESALGGIGKKSSARLPMGSAEIKIGLPDE